MPVYVTGSTGGQAEGDIATRPAIHTEACHTRPVTHCHTHKPVTWPKHPPSTLAVPAAHRTPWVGTQCLPKHACPSMQHACCPSMLCCRASHDRSLHVAPSPQRSARRGAVQQPECVVVLDHRGKTDANILVETFELKNVQLAAHKFDHVEPSPHEEDLHRAHHDGPSADLQAIRVPLHLHLLAYVAERILEFSVFEGGEGEGSNVECVRLVIMPKVEQPWAWGQKGWFVVAEGVLKPNRLCVSLMDRWRASNPMAPLAPLAPLWRHHIVTSPHDLPSHALLTCIG